MAALAGINVPMASVTPMPKVDGNAPTMTPSTTVPAVIDGTPVRVVVLGFAAAAGLWALHIAGLRFSVGVSN